MGFVYIYRQHNEDRFTVGATKDFDERKRVYARANPGLKLYRRIETSDHFTLEKFLHKELAEKRDRAIQSMSWHLVTEEEMNLAVEQARTQGKEYLECKKNAAAVKNAKTDGTWLEPNERLNEIYDRLSSLFN